MEKIDFHVHTFYSDCASRDMTLEKVLLEYEKLGFEKIALTDHCYLDRLHIFFEEKQLVEKIREKFNLKLKVLISSEICCVEKNGRLIYENPLDLCLDHVSVAPHHYADKKILQLGKNLFDDAKEMLLALARRKDIKVVLHPFVHIRDNEFVKDKIASIPGFYWKEFAKRVKGKAVEIHKDMDNRWLPMIEELVKEKVSLVVGSDCHSLEDIGKTGNAVALIKKIDASYSELAIGF